MSVSSIGNATNVTQSASPQPKPESAEIQRAGKDHDGDSDDGGASVVQAPPTPSVNTSGQAVGQVVNTSA